MYAGISQGRVEYLVYYICHFCSATTTVSTATYPLSMPSITDIEICSTPTDQFDWSVSHAYVINQNAANCMTIHLRYIAQPRGEVDLLRTLT